MMLAVLALHAAPPAVAGDQKVALVVGAANYRNVPPLRNTLNDARGVEAALRRLGFAVEAVLDPDRLALETAIRGFGQRARGAEVALFYYAGHAVEYGGRNWLLPVSASVHSARDLRFEAAELDAILEQLEGTARVSVIVLDSCRENPFRSVLGENGRGLPGGGLSQVQAATGTLVEFSTAPGTVAADGTGLNSPFTGALLKWIEKPGLEIRQMFSEVRREVNLATRKRQVPWEQSALEGSLYLVAPHAAPAAAAALPSPAVAAAASAPRSPLDPDALFWDSVRNSTNPSDFRAYLARFENGVFADLARLRLAGLQPARPADPAPAMQLDPRTALIAAMASVPANERDAVAKRYMDAPPIKALAMAPTKNVLWWRSKQPNMDAAELAALEGCQIYSNQPCVLIARGEDVVAPPSNGQRPKREMPRVSYAGAFDIKQLPFDLGGPASVEMAAYATATAPRALAIHPWGRGFTVIGAENQRAAEEKALATCNADPVRKGQDGPCYLYAVANEVVLPKRHTGAPSPAVMPEGVEPAGLRSRLLAAMPFVPPEKREEIAGTYIARPGWKALAISPEQHASWRQVNLSSQAIADTRTLEGCQAMYGAPCVLVARGDEVMTAARLDEWSRRDMPRVRYAGRFDIGQVPFDLGIAAPKGMAAYAAATIPKAIAMHPWGKWFPAIGAESQRAAEAKALAECNADPLRKGQDGPCYLYASGNDVVFPDRRKEPKP